MRVTLRHKSRVTKCQGGSQISGIVCECQRGTQGLCKSVKRGTGVVYESEKGS
jgi:hypothetical protein